MVERFDPVKIKNAGDSRENSTEEVCSRRSTIDFNDLEDNAQEDEELERQNPFLLGQSEMEEQDESENGMFLEESVDQSQNDIIGLVVDEQIPQAKIVGVGDEKIVQIEADRK